MTAPQNFRSAFNGFNREDVVHYIEFVNTNHTNRVNQLLAQIDALQAQLDAKAPDTEAQERCAQLEEELRQQQQANEALRQELAQRDTDSVEITVDTSESEALALRCASLEKQLTAALEDKLRAESQRDNAKAAAAQTYLQQELETYRRAERLERIARERSEQVYRLANGALADATVKVDEAFSQISTLTDLVTTQLQQLQSAVADSKQAFSDAASTLYAIRPDNQE